MKRAGFAIVALLVALPVSAARADAGGIDLIVSPTPQTLTNGSLTTATAAISRLRRDPLVRSSELVFDRSERQALFAMKQLALSQTWKLTVRTQQDARTLEAKARARGAEISIEQNSVALGLDAPVDAGTAVESDAPAQAGGDTLEAQQWGLHNRGAAQKLAIDDLTSVDVPGKPGEDVGIDRAPPEPTDPAKKVIVAVLDTGIDFDHPDLKDRIARHPKECEALAQYKACLANDTQAHCDARWIKTDADGNGYPLDCAGWNITAGRNRKTGIWGDNDPTDDTGHGTHVAGIISGAANGTGIRGVAQNVEILPVKVIKTAPNQPIRPQDTSSADPVPSPNEGGLRWTAGFGDLIARGLLYAIRSGAQVVNLSLAWPSGVDSVLMRRMVALAQSRGMIIVASAGNDSADSRVMPCQYDGVICVASHNPDGALSHFSNFGSFVDIAAPGLDILSSWPLGMRSVNFTALDGYEIKNGTSMASPFVAGMAARLLEAGYSPREVYARLMTGARPSAPDASKKYTRSGNADLGRAFAATPQPLILEAAKDIVRASWDGVATRLPLTVSLKNFWAPATGVHVTAALTGVGSEGAHLDGADWSFPAWDADAVNALAATLVIDQPNVDGRLMLALTVTSDQDTAGRRLLIPVEISSPVGVAAAYPCMKSLPIVDGGGGAVDPQADLRTVTALDGKPGQDYVALDDGGQQWGLQLLVEDGSSYKVAASAQIPAVNGDLLIADRLDVDQDGKSEYVLVFRVPPQNGRPAPSLEFQYYDSSLKPVGPKVVDYDNSLSVVPERFTWMKASVAGKPLLVPAWISLGLTPDADKPPFDPWNPNPQDTPELHFYYLTPQGLRAVSTPKDEVFVQALTQTPDQLAHGIVPVLLGKGYDYILNYSIAEVSDAALGAQTPLELDHYRMLLGVSDLTPIHSLDPSLGLTGTVFSGASTRGANRTTLVLQAPELRVKDSIQRPTVMTDSVVRVTGAFLGAKTASTFSETHYQIQFNDLVSGQVATTSLDRFSFLPAFIFSRTLFPVTVAPATGAEHLPAILIPASLGATDATEIVVPDYDAQGRLTGLSRPARFRWAAAPGCEVLGNPAVDPASGVEQIVFFCGSRFLRLPLSF